MQTQVDSERLNHGAFMLFVSGAVTASVAAFAFGEAPVRIGEMRGLPLLKVLGLVTLVAVVPALLAMERSRFRQLTTAVLMLFLSAPVWCVASLLTLDGLNRYLDSSPAELSYAIVETKTSGSGRSGRWLKGWLLPSRETIAIPVDAETFARIAPGSRLVINLRTGALGRKWGNGWSVDQTAGQR